MALPDIGSLSAMSLDVSDSLTVTTKLTYAIGLDERRGTTKADPVLPASRVSVDSSMIFGRGVEVVAARFETGTELVDATPIATDAGTEVGQRVFAIPSSAQFGSSSLVVEFRGPANLDGHRRSLLPSSAIDVDLQGWRPKPVSISMPRNVTANVGVLTLEFDFDRYLAEFKRVHELVREDRLKSDAVMTRLSSMTSDLQKEPLRELKLVRGLLLRDALSPALIGDVEGRQALALGRQMAGLSVKRIDSLIKVLDRSVATEKRWLSEALDEMISALEQAVELKILVDFRLFGVTSMLSSDVPPELLRFNSVKVAFTTEREPGLHGFRSALSLAGLAAVMLVMSSMDTTKVWVWLNPPITRLFGYEMATSPSRIPADNWPSYTSAIVALLVFFPLGLYTQFIKNRTASALGNYAQSALFGLLSLLYALPIVPAALCASGRDSSVVGAACFVIGAVFAAASSALLIVYSRPALQRFRLRSLGFRYRRVLRAACGKALQPANRMLRALLQIWRKGKQ